MANSVSITHSTGLLSVGNLTGRNIELRSINGGIHLNNLEAFGDFDVEANGNLSQTANGMVVVQGSTNLETAGNILLDGANNDFQGPVSAEGFDVTLHDAYGSLQLGRVFATGDFAARSSGGDITQSATSSIIVGGATTLSAFAGGLPASILLTNTSNDFGGVVNILALRFELADVDGAIQLGEINGLGGDQVLSRSIQSSVFDANSRYSSATNRTGFINSLTGAVRRVAEQSGLSELLAKLRRPLKETNVAFDSLGVHLNRSVSPETTEVNDTDRDTDGIE